MSDTYSVADADYSRFDAGSEREYDYYKVINEERDLIYWVYHFADNGRYWIKNQQTKKVLKGGDTKDAIIAAIDGFNIVPVPEPEPEPEPDPEVPEEPVEEPEVPEEPVEEPPVDPEPEPEPEPEPTVDEPTV